MRNPGDGKEAWQERLHERSMEKIPRGGSGEAWQEDTDLRAATPAGHGETLLPENDQERRDNPEGTDCPHNRPYFVAKVELPPRNAEKKTVQGDSVPEETQGAVPSPDTAEGGLEETDGGLSARRGSAREVYEWLESCTAAVLLIILVFTFLVRSATVSGSSMVPTLHDGERLILQQVGYNNPQYGDIVVIDRTQGNSPPIIKRVIGKAGDFIDINFQTGEVWRNGDLLEEPYINEPTLSKRDVEFPVEVPEGCLFVMGDNRNASADSRMSEIGMIDLRRVMGKAVFRFMPLDAIGGLE